MRKLTVLFALAVLFNITNASAQNAPVTDCDKLAANPDDPQRKASGVAIDKIDASAAIPACEAALRQYPDDVRLNHQLGRAYVAAKNYQAAVEHYRKAAEQGYAPAQVNLGLRYQDGRGVSQDYREALVWYRKAAEQGYAPAQVNLGKMYENGQGVSKDETQAVAWYRKAAEQGYAIAQANLGVMYENGRGVSQDYREALVWYRKAAEQGYAPAQVNLGFMYQNGQGVSKDETQAVAWYRKAADQGYALAQTNLGRMYENGRGVSQDYRQAVAWYRKAAEQGNEFAKNKITALASIDPDAKHDPNDVVAQVLNYSNFGNDDGVDGSYWYQDKSDKCRYKLVSKQMQVPGLPDVLMQALTNTLRQSIDLNVLDPRNITFQHRPWSGCIMNCGVSTSANSDYQPQYGSGVNTIIQHDADVLFQTEGQLNLERLQRGWTLIYSKYCKGKEKPF